MMQQAKHLINLQSYSGYPIPAVQKSHGAQRAAKKMPWRSRVR